MALCLKNVTGNSARALKTIGQYSKLAAVPNKESGGRRLIISCRRKEFNFYSDELAGASQRRSKFDEVVLASKGWSHRKSRGDHFIVHPDPNFRLEKTRSFEELGVHSALIEALKTEGIVEATTFQGEAIPKVSAGGHLVLAAETGCGKTIAYLTPLMQSLMVCRADKFNTPKALVLVPNRELAHQIGGVASRLAAAVGLRVKTLVGGHVKRMMSNPEYSEVDILVATPGVIGKLSTVGIYKLNEVLTTVLDEADTLLDDSFNQRMSGLIYRLNLSQVILVSATYPKRLPDYLEHVKPNLLEIKSPRLHRPLLNVMQKFVRLTRSARPASLLELAKTTKQPLLVFTNRNETCNWLAMFLRESGVLCANINGDQAYEIRMKQWEDFQSGRARILSATDVGSRGLDTGQVRQVLNYDFPLYAADYIHRVGRVGRLGSPDDCKVTNFVCGQLEVKLVQEIELAIRTGKEIAHVDGNITKVLQRRILRGVNTT